MCKFAAIMRCSILIGLFSTFGAISGAHAQFCPANGAVLTSGSPFTVRACDLNGDDHIDIVVANADTNNVSAMLNNGNGTFASAQLFPAGQQPVDINCCDVDGDGDLDLVTANKTPSQVNVLLNNGMSGGVLQLSAPTPYSVGSAPWGVSCVRLNADARPDVATSNYTGKSVSVLLNNGDGTFGTRTDYLTGDSGTYEIAACDLDGDGKQDVVVTNMTSQTITSFKSNGDGTLTKIGSFSVGHLIFPWSLDCCDIDGDGHPDVVTANGGDNTISILFNNGSGRFDTRPVIHVTGAGQPYKITCFDIDGDGDNDVLTANLGSDDVTVFANSGTGTLTKVDSLPIGANVGSVACADVDGDGDVDVIANSTTQVFLFKNQCAGCTSAADCNDSNPCTRDLCASGICSHDPIDCADLDPCTIDSCDVGTGNCLHAPVSCPSGQRCFQGECLPSCTTSAGCDDGIACTHDSCQSTPNGGVCVHTADDTLCDNSLFCAGEICDLLNGCVLNNGCFAADGNPCPDLNSCDEGTKTCGGCKQPELTAIGCRYLQAIPADQGATPVALVVLGDCGDSNSACVFRYVQSKCAGGPNDGQNCNTDADCPRSCSGGPNNGNSCISDGDCPASICRGRCDSGTLGSQPYYKPANEWGTVKIHGDQIRPRTIYGVRAECDFAGGLVHSSASTATTWAWGEVDNNNAVNISDVSAVVDRFKGINSPTIAFEATNLTGPSCIMDNATNIVDVAADVDAFKGFAFVCPATCP